MNFYLVKMCVHEIPSIYPKLIYQIYLILLYLKVFQNRKNKIPTSKFNEAMLELVKTFPPPAIKGKYVKIKYCMQLPTPTPQFVFFCNLPQYVKEPYKRFIENKMRELFDFKGVPIVIYFRQK